MDNSVLVLGVGPEQGLGVALCKKFAEEGRSEERRVGKECER